MCSSESFLHSVKAVLAGQSSWVCGVLLIVVLIGLLYSSVVKAVLARQSSWVCGVLLSVVLVGLLYFSDRWPDSAAAFGSLVSTLILAVTLVFLKRQLAQMDETRKMEGTTRVFQSLTDETMAEARRSVRRAYAEGMLDPQEDFSGLPSELRKQIHMVWVSLDNLGILVDKCFVERQLALQMFHDQTLEFWCMLSAFIDRERKRRRVEYQIYFEQLYELSLEYRLKCRREHPWKAVAFDLDGLLLDTEKYYTAADRKLAAKYGKEKEWCDNNVKGKMIGKAPTVAFAIFKDELVPDLSGVTPDVLFQERQEIFKQLLPERLTLMDGASLLIDALTKSGCQLAIATGSDRETVDLCLERAGGKELTRRFPVQVTATSVKKGKPDPETYVTTAAELNVQLNEMVVLEDSPSGCQAGAKAGAFVIAVPNEYSRHQDFTAASVILPSLIHRRLYAELGLAYPKQAAPGRQRSGGGMCIA